ncbi:alpha/beta hydrolase [Allorhizobium borbori]|uniref:Phospholipase/carboxylesterase n=1 Tax=Allorhizobium borbori TaxID=485907 RepID=A0A7W6JYP7_9HYPH|nr:alpha/beta hydrolase [Allorhizobium borbori]MBB4101995.1 phospholipase/carboxylesterase [Allorhizobium borbori]
MTGKDYTFKGKTGLPARPILFTFHGTGGDENQFFDFGARLLPEASVISPRGDVSENGALRFFKRRAEGHYDMADLARATEKMAAFVQAQKALNDSVGIIGLGYSNGANILANVLIEHPGLFDAAVLMHPLIPFVPKPADLTGTDVLITAGRRDPICPPDLTEGLSDYLTGSKAMVTLEWHEGGHDIRQNEIAAIQGFLARFA